MCGSPLQTTINEILQVVLRYARRRKIGESAAVMTEDEYRSYLGEFYSNNDLGTIGITMDEFIDSTFEMYQVQTAA